MENDLIFYLSHSLKTSLRIIRESSLVREILRITGIFQIFDTFSIINSNILTY